MQLAIDTIQKDQGGVVIINNGKIVSKIQLNIAGLLSDKKASEIAEENKIFKNLKIKKKNKQTIETLIVL